MASTTSSILTTLRKHDSVVNWQQLLSDIISFFDCSTGTIHILDDESKLLKLQAQQGIPPFILPKNAEIPIGKGMVVLLLNAGSLWKCVIYRQMIPE